jgi:hypothetical protein
LFERVRNGTDHLLDEHEALWRLAQLADKPLSAYTPNAGSEYQQRHVTTATSPYSHPAMPVNVWRSINRATLMPKLRSLAWTIHAGGYRTAVSYARFTNASPQCPRCNQAAETVIHALVECQEVSAFWSALFRRLGLSQMERPEATAILSLYVSRAQRGQRSANSCVLAVACGLWVVHRARVRRHFSQTHTPYHALMAEWRALAREILLAKKCTAVERHTERQFTASWAWLLEVTGLLSMA